MDNLRQQLTEHLPPLLAGTSLDRLTGDAVRWRTVQNLRSQKKIPEECFLRQGPRKTLIVRDPFLEWWMSQFD